MNNDVGRVVVDAATEAAGAQRGAGREVTLSTGVVVRVKAVPQAALLALRRKFAEPKVPVWRNEAKGRDEENPSDPDYMKAMAQYRADVGTAALHIMMLLGTEVVSLPDGFAGPDDAGWLEERDLLGVSSGDGARARYLDWLLIRAAPANADVNALAFAVGRATGTTEADVQEALKSVRS